jgi:hypothetical protein
MVLLALCPTPKLEGRPTSAVYYGLVSIFSSTLHIQGIFPLSANTGQAMSWWKGIHLTWITDATTANIRDTQKL